MTEAEIGNLPRAALTSGQTARGRGGKSDVALIFIPVATSLWMAYRARKKKSLTSNGCLTAFFVGATIGLLGGGGTVAICTILGSHQRAPLMLGVGSDKVNVSNLVLASSKKLVSKIRFQVAMKARIFFGGVGSNMSQIATPEALGEGTNASSTTALGEGSVSDGIKKRATSALGRVKEAASTTTAIASDTASRVIGKNTLSSLLLKKDEKGHIIATEPQQLLPFAALINFFFTSTYLTKKGASVKKCDITVVEDEAYEESGNRSALQVLCNGGAAAGLAIAVHACRSLRYYGFFTNIAGENGSPSTPTSALGLGSLVCFLATIPNTVLALALISQIAAAQGDTWSSEIGVLSKSKHACLIIGLRRVPKGTNGGITLLGTAAALGAGVQLGATLVAAQTMAMVGEALARGDVSLGSVVQYAIVHGIKYLIPSRALLFLRMITWRGLTLMGMSRGKEDITVDLQMDEGPLRPAIVPVALTASVIFTTCVLAAVGGSLLDSVLGQFLQETKEKRSKTCGNQNNQTQAESTPSHTRETATVITHVSGMNILANHGVNFTTGLIVMFITVAALHRKPSCYV